LKVGDLVYFKMDGKRTPGALTAIKYFQRIKNLTDNRAGVIISIHGDNCYVAFGEDAIVLSKYFLEVVSESR
jgi:hypothetical protein